MDSIDYSLWHVGSLNGQDEGHKSEKHVRINGGRP